MRGAALALLVLASLSFPAQSQGKDVEATALPATPCATAAGALARGDLALAREKYLDALADGSRNCAVEGLGKVTANQEAAAELCAQGKALAAEGKSAAAKRRYADALRLDAGSECAKGDAADEKSEDKDEKGGVAKAAEWTTDLTKLLGTSIGALLLFAALILILIVFLRRRKPSLAIEPFGDEGVEPKVGSAVTGLVEGHLTDLSRRHKGRNDGLLLDFVVADTEIMAANKGLENALSGLAEVSQLKLLIALAGLADRLWGKHLIAKGELMPKGRRGHGVVVALQSEKDGLEARGALWRKGRRAKEGPNEKDPSPYYELAEPAAAWIQYETACSLADRVRLITRSARSFSLLSLGLTAQRERDYKAAAEHYTSALRHDPENVAALFNLGRILAADEVLFRQGVMLVVRALVVLKIRYEELS
jgi:tetratricopeptide (TPR) repeat protein